MLDAIGHRYGMMPHEVLQLDAEDLSLAVACYHEHWSSRLDRIKQLGNVYKKALIPIPVPVVVTGEY